MPATQSEPDINTAITMSDYVTNRTKRPRPNNSPPSDPFLSRQEFQDFISSWKQEQEKNLSKLLAEQTALISKVVTDIKEIKLQNAKIHESNAAICKTNGDIERSMVFLNQSFEDLKKEVEILRKERLEQRSYIENLEKKIIDLQYRSRSAGIEIRNIPTTESETTTELLKSVSSIGKLVGVPLLSSEIRDIYRLPGKSFSATASRPIIAEFTTVLTKQKVLSAVRSYNRDKKLKEDKLNTEQIGIPGQNQPVYVAEQLPASTKKLFHQTRNFAQKNKFMFCWISKGSIFLRKQVGDKQILIRSEKCLQDLENKSI